MPMVPNNFSGLITFTRASGATFVGSNGLIQLAATNVPRFDYDPVTLAVKGLLIEEQRTNLLTYSEQFGNAYWQTASNVTVDANQIVAPDGTLTADLLREAATTATHRLSANTNLAVPGATTSTPNVLSCYFKAGGGVSVPRLSLADTSGTNQCSAFFNLSTVTVTSVVAGGATVNSTSITPIGNGWYRCVLVATITGGAGGIFAYIALGQGTTISYEGSTSNFVYIWGAQLEQGAFSTSYIPTVASQVTRSADVASVNTLSPWYNAAEGTLFAEASSFGLSAAGNFVANFTDGTLSNRGGIYAISTGNAVAGYMVSGGVIQADISASGVAGNGAVFKVAFAFKANNFAASVNSAAALTDTSGTVATTLDRLGIGTINNGNAINGHIRRIAYWPRRLSNVDLQALTA